MSAPLNRADWLERIRTREPWDIVVIGGGATGLGTAVDAAARGYRTLLIEAHDFAKGTSSRSTKLIHGGVRYLAQGRIGLVREALHERGVLRANAPQLVHDRDFLVPSYHWWTTPYYRVGLGLYDLLAGSKRLGHARSIGKDEAERRLPTLKSVGLRGGVIYRDSQFDDARLAIALMRTLQTLGGTALNYVAATGMIRSGDRLEAVQARDVETGEEFAIRARVVVNAAGVFADEVRRLDDPGALDKLAPSQGTHIVLDRSFLPGDLAILVPRTDDGRVIFAIPWLGRLLTSPIYQAQKQLARRFVPDDATVRAALGALDRQGGGLTPAALSQALAIPPLRLDGLIAKLQRLLNLDGYEVLRLDRQRDVVELDLAMLKRQFELG